MSDEGSSDGERDEGDEEEGEEEEEVIRVLEWKPTGLQRPLGEWEKHTTVGRLNIYLASVFNSVLSPHHFSPLPFSLTHSHTPLPSLSLSSPPLLSRIFTLPLLQKGDWFKTDGQDGI